MKQRILIRRRQLLDRTLGTINRSSKRPLRWMHIVANIGEKILPFPTAVDFIRHTIHSIPERIELDNPPQSRWNRWETQLTVIVFSTISFAKQFAVNGVTLKLLRKQTSDSKLRRLQWQKPKPVGNALLLRRLIDKTSNHRALESKKVS